MSLGKCLSLVLQGEFPQEKRMIKREVRSTLSSYYYMQPRLGGCQGSTLARNSAWPMVGPQELAAQRAPTPPPSHKLLSVYLLLASTSLSVSDTTSPPRPPSRPRPPSPLSPSPRRSFRRRHLHPPGQPSVCSCALTTGVLGAPLAHTQTPTNAHC
jgi:hypothetical protein